MAPRHLLSGLALLVLVGGCHVILPLGTRGDGGTELGGDMAAPVDSNGRDSHERDLSPGDEALSCANSANWGCSPGTMPPACILTCGARVLRCQQLLTDVTCTCKLNDQDLCLPQTYSMVGYPACVPNAFAFLCVTALDGPEFACCRQ